MTDPAHERRSRIRWPQRLYRQGTEPDPRFTLANERTFLAWIRTSLAFIAGGIALNALSFEIDPGVKHWLSIIALSLGALTAAWAWYSWLRVELAMRNKTPLPHSPGLIVLTSALLAVAVIAAIAFI
jgi:putative membrane protein